MNQDQLCGLGPPNTDRQATDYLYFELSCDIILQRTDGSQTHILRLYYSLVLNVRIMIDRSLTLLPAHMMLVGVVQMYLRCCQVLSGAVSLPAETLESLRWLIEHVDL